MDVYSFSAFGYEGSLVTVDAELRDGIPAVDIVGLADGSVKESRARVRAAVENSGFDFPAGRVFISLAPADLRKDGAGFDLAMAIAVLCAKTPAAHTADSCLCYGELELSGKLRPMRGTYAALQTALKAGITKAVVPADLPDAEIPSGMKACKAKTLKDAFRIVTMCDDKNTAPAKQPEFDNEITFPVDGDGTLEAIKDTSLLRAMMIAAAGRHHLLVVGPPGCGKTLALQHFPELLPSLTAEESAQVARIQSIAGLIPREMPSLRTPPFRMPHQTASIEGMCGGGPRLAPGEISLAHNGVLFLDEAAEFKTSVLQMLRVPLEQGYVTLSRAGRSSVFPASFQLLLATTPCPCGNYGSKDKVCLCASSAVAQYWHKFSAPLLDRIAIRVQADKSSEEAGRMTLSGMRESIARATRIQRTRRVYNQNIPPAQLGTICRMSEDARKLAESRTDLSPRGLRNLLEVSRTIADLEGEELILERHIGEAIRLISWSPDPSYDVHSSEGI